MVVLVLAVVPVADLVVDLVVLSSVHQEGSLVVRHLVVVNCHRHRLLVAVLPHSGQPLHCQVAQEADKRLSRL